MSDEGPSGPGLDLGPLAKDEKLVDMLRYLATNVDGIQALVVPLVETNVYANLSTEDQVKHDIFVSYTLTSLFWVYLRTLGRDPNHHAVKCEVERVQEYVARYKKIIGRKRAPQLDKAAAKRFVRSGLWDPNDPRPQQNQKTTFKEEED